MQGPWGRNGSSQSRRSRCEQGRRGTSMVRSACGGGGLGARLTLQEALSGAGPAITPAPGVGFSRPRWPTHLAGALCFAHLGLGSAPPSCGTWRNLLWKMGVMVACAQQGHCEESSKHGTRGLRDAQRACEHRFCCEDKAPGPEALTAYSSWRPSLTAPLPPSSSASSSRPPRLPLSGPSLSRSLWALLGGMLTNPLCVPGSAEGARCPGDAHFRDD